MIQTGLATDCPTKYKCAIYRPLASISLLINIKRHDCDKYEPNTSNNKYILLHL